MVIVLSLVFALLIGAASFLALAPVYQRIGDAVHGTQDRDTP
jgi:capsular polysaccharide biosynthesis protein